MKYYMFNGLNKDEKNDKKLNKKRLTKVLILLIVIILIITFVILYSSNETVKDFFDKNIFRKEVYEENLPWISLEGIRTENAFAYGNYIAVLDQNKLQLYNKYGNMEETLEIDISVPIFSSNGKYLCIAENGGQDIYLIFNKNILWQKEITGDIKDVNVNENGYVTISITGTSYKTVVDVFDVKGDELFKKYLSNSNVIATDISRDNKYLAVAEANFSGITIESCVEIISIEKAKTGNVNSIEYIYNADLNNLIINVKYQNKNKLMCMYDNRIDYIQDNKNEKFRELPDSNSLFADVNLIGKIIKVVKKDALLFNSAADIQIIDINNEEVFTYEIDSLPKQVYTNGNNVIGINLGTEAIFMNNNGWLIKRYKSQQEIEKIVVGDGVAGIISRGKIKIISL